MPNLDHRLYHFVAKGFNKAQKFRSPNTFLSVLIIMVMTKLNRESRAVNLDQRRKPRELPKNVQHPVYRFDGGAFIYPLLSDRLGNRQRRPNIGLDAHRRPHSQHQPTAALFSPQRHPPRQARNSHICNRTGPTEVESHLQHSSPLCRGKACMQGLNGWRTFSYAAHHDFVQAGYVQKAMRIAYRTFVLLKQAFWCACTCYQRCIMLRPFYRK